MRCGNNSCPVCGPLNGRRIAGAIQLADPPWWFSLTLVGDSSAEIVKNVSRVIHYARQDIPTLEDAWAAEHNPAHTGAHIHGYLHAGDNDRLIHEGAFDNAVRRSGVGNHWAMDPVKNPGPSYFAYPMKALAGEDYEAERFLELNGPPKRRQLIHASRGFWRDGRGGPRLKNRAEAEVLAFRRSR